MNKILSMFALTTIVVTSSMIATNETKEIKEIVVLSLNGATKLTPSKSTCKILEGFDPETAFYVGYYTDDPNGNKTFHSNYNPNYKSPLSNWKISKKYLEKYFTKTIEGVYENIPQFFPCPTGFKGEMYDSRAIVAYLTDTILGEEGDLEAKLGKLGETLNEIYSRPEKSQYFVGKLRLMFSQNQ